MNESRHIIEIPNHRTSDFPGLVVGREPMAVDAGVGEPPQGRLVPFDQPDIPESVAGVIRELKQPWNDRRPIPEPYASRFLPEIHAIANEYRFRLKGSVFHVSPNVPMRMIEEVQSALGVPHSERVVAMFARSAFRGWGAGLAVTDHAIHWRTGSPARALEVGPFRIPYAMLTRYVIRWHRSHKCAFIGSSLFQKGMAASFAIAYGDADRILYELLHEIQQAVLRGCGLDPLVLFDGVAYGRGTRYLV